MVLLLAVGFVSILAQVVLLRELSVAFYGIELIYILAIGVWLLCTAAGAAIGRQGPVTAAAGLSWPLPVFALLLPLDMLFVRSVRVTFSGIAGAYLPFPTQLCAMSLTLLPVGIVLGIAFRQAAQRYMAEGGSLARAYAIESLGGLAGGLLSTALLIASVPNLAAGLLCALAAACCALLCRPPRAADSRASRGLRFGALVVAALALIGIVHSGDLDHRTTAWTHPGLIAVLDTPYGRLAVTARDGQVTVFENDSLSFETEGTGAEEFVHLAALQHPHPRQVLVLGGGVEGIVREVLKHAPSIVDYVELNPGLLELAAEHLPPDDGPSLLSPRVRVTRADPRRFLETVAGYGLIPAYDLILVGMPEPSSGQANRYYTREFFVLCAARLAGGGILAFRMRSSENFWTPQFTRQAVSVVRALEAAMQSVLMIPGTTNVFLGSDGPLVRDPETLAARLSERGIRGRIVSAPYLRYKLQNDRFDQAASTLRRGDAPANTDVRPVCYQYAVMVWLSKFYPRAALLDADDIWKDGARNRWAWVAIVVVMAAFLLLVRRLQGVRRLLLVALAGALGMILETVLMLHYQLKHGVLFQDIGLLLMSFMAGLAVGAMLVDRLLRPARGFLLAGASMLAVAAFSGAWIAWRIQGGGSADLAETCILQMLAGASVAGIFAYAGMRGEVDQERIVGPLYAADLAGGSIGSVLASLLLVPSLGLDATAWLSVVLCLACIPLLRT